MRLRKGLVSGGSGALEQASAWIHRPNLSATLELRQPPKLRALLDLSATLELRQPPKLRALLDLSATLELRQPPRFLALLDFSATLEPTARLSSIKHAHLGTFVTRGLHPLQSPPCLVPRTTTAAKESTRGPKHRVLRAMRVRKEPSFCHLSIWADSCPIASAQSFPNRRRPCAFAKRARFWWKRSTGAGFRLDPSTKASNCNTQRM